MKNSIKSIQRSIGISNIKRAMNQDSKSVETIKEMMDQNNKMIEKSLTGKGLHVDSKI
jgi:hypothetical protein